MILLVHMLLGALIGQRINNIWLAVILAFSTHYLLDLIPHIEYPIENIKLKNWIKSAPEFFYVFLDFIFGIFLIFIFSKNYPAIYLCAITAIIPDGLSYLEIILKSKFLAKLKLFHQKAHFLKDKKIPNLWRIFSQVFVVVICLILIRF